jgi:hypothetical protein
MIVNELHIAAIQLHQKVEPGIISQFIKKIERLDLRLCQRPYIRKPASRLNVLPLIDCRKQSRVPVENGDIEIRLFTFGHFAATVRFNRLKQYSSKIRSVASHLVKDRG